MKQKTKKQNFPAKLFIISSLSAFILFALIFIFIKINFISNINHASEQKPISNNKYYLNKNYSKGDYFMTKIPSLNDMLAGPIITDLDPILGNKNAPVAIVEFSDFKCDFCQKQEQALKQIIQGYNGKIKIIWKDYPENNEDSISFQAAIAARCAQEQSQFWPFHDLLYKNNDNLKQLNFLNIADQLNLNRAEFVQCLDDDNIKQLIRDNIEEANALNITGIPFIYVNDQEIMGEITFEELKRIVEIELNKISNF